MKIEFSHLVGPHASGFVGVCLPGQHGIPHLAKIDLLLDRSFESDGAATGCNAERRAIVRQPRSSQRIKERTAIDVNAVTRGPAVVAGFAEMSRHRSNRHEQLRQRIGLRRSSVCVARQNRNLLIFADSVRKGTDALRLEPADIVGPLRRFSGAVEAAEHVILEVVALIGTFGHHRFIEANAARTKELPVDERICLGIVFGYEHVGNAEQQRSIGSDPDRHPFSIKSCRRIVVERIDADEIRPRVFHPLEIVESVTRRTPCGVDAEHDDRLGFEKVETVVDRSDPQLHAEKRARVVRPERYGCPSAHVPAEVIEHVGYGDSGVRPEIGKQDGFVAVVLLSAFQLGGNKLHRLIP